MCEIREREREVQYNKKSNGDVVLKKNNKTLKELTTYKFLNECLSFPTNTPLRAVNMHA